MKISTFRFSLALVFLLTAMLACALPSNPQPPLPSLTPSTAGADAFEKAFQDAVSQSKNGAFTVIIKQEDLSSWLALRAPDLAKQQGYEWPLKNVQAGLSDGKITLYGILSVKNVPETAIQLVVTPSIDAQGQIAIKIESGQLGIVGVPADLTQNLSKTVQQTLTNQLAQLKGKYKLTALTIKDGVLTLTGQMTP